MPSGDSSFQRSLMSDEHVPPGTENWFAGICDRCGAPEGKPCVEGCPNTMPPSTHCPQCGNTVGTPHNPWCPEAPHIKEEDPFQ